MGIQTTEPRLFKDKLRRELDRRAMKITALARRFAPDGDSREFDSARRMIHRHLSGAAIPNRATRRRYEQLLHIETGALEPDDEEADPAMELLTAVRRLVQAEIKGNGPTAPAREPSGRVAR